jgi:hypothetical protein
MDGEKCIEGEIGTINKPKKNEKYEGVSIKFFQVILI